MFFNAEIVLTPALEGMSGAVYRAEQLSKEKRSNQLLEEIADQSADFLKKQ